MLTMYGVLGDRSVNGWIWENVDGIKEKFERVKTGFRESCECT